MKSIFKWLLMGIIGMMVFIGFNSTPTQNQEKDFVIDGDQPPEFISMSITKVENPYLILNDAGICDQIDEGIKLGGIKLGGIYKNLYTKATKLPTHFSFRSPRDGFRYSNKNFIS